MKRLLYVSDAASIHTQRWAAHFSKFGIDVHVASFRPAVIENVTVHIIPKMKLGKLGYIFAIPYLKKLTKKIRPDVVHAQYVTSYGFLAAVSNLKPLVITAWGTDVLITPNQSWLMKQLTIFALHKADRITTVAKHMNEAIALLGFSTNIISAIPFGVDTELFCFPVNKPNTDTLRIISTRNFSQIYSVHTIIDAIYKLTLTGQAVHLDLVGDGPLRQNLERQVTRLNLIEKVTFHGHVSHSKLVERLGNAHIFISSALSDGNNISLNEAMACGCFPIATNIPANTQWITHQKNGLLYTKGDSAELTNMIILASAESLRDNVRKLNRELVEQQADWSVCVNTMNQIYTDLMKKN